MAPIPPSPATKYRPTVGAGTLVQRPRLLDQLEEGRKRRLVLIHAPAGFGKTTLADQWCHWLADEGQPVAWMSIDADDNRPVWLVAHLIQALRKVYPDLARDLLAALEQSAEGGERHVLAALINEIDAAGHPVFVVVDDWHRVSDPRSLAAMDFLLEHGDSLLHLVVASRSRAGLPLGRLRVADQLVEIGITELRFDRDETSQLLSVIKNLPVLAEDDRRQLLERTDGWIAALRLATLSLRGVDDPSLLIKNLSGRDRSISGYLAENVLDQLPEPTLDFLLRTSLPERLCAGLATALTGVPFAQATLEDIEAEDLFLRPLDDDQTWFGYHHLFAEFLRLRLARDRAGDVQDLHLRAAAWFAANNLTSESVDHALAAGDPDLAVAVVAEQATTLLESSRMATLGVLAGKLPTALVAGQPQLQLALGWSSCLRQHLDEAQVATDAVARTLARTRATGAAPRESMLVENRLLAMSISLYQDRIDGMAELAADCRARAETLRPWLVTIAACHETLVSLHRFDFTEARRWQAWARPFYDRSSGFMIRGLGLCLAGIAAMQQLDVDGAREHLTQALGWAEAEAGRNSYSAQMALAQLGVLDYQIGDVASAERNLAEADDLGEMGLLDFILPVYAVLPRLKAAAGDVEGAAALLERGAALARRLRLNRLAAAVIHQQARLGLPSSNPPPAIPELTGEPSDGIAIAIADSLAAARIHRGLAAGQAVEVVAIAREQLHQNEIRNRPLAVLRAQVRLAGALQQAGQVAEAREHLVPALRTSVRTGVVAPITDGGSSITDLLTTMAPEVYDDAPAIKSWLESRSARPTGTTRDPVPEGVPPLTARETEILGLLDAGRSNQQIARTLHLSTNTVKWYLKALYHKFDVARRQECVAAARAANLLP